ncbi:hypothetical protein B0O99DRAFT_513659 [Bisporella sp. PMI_857]|nr:hypothetical protein B0O99DRAFT_513659 [Bisporella sp. PMI_857]
MSSSNYSFYAVPVAWALAMAPHAYAMNAAPKTFDIRSPRSYEDDLKKDQTIDQATRNKIIRADAASKNGFENLAFFATGVLAGNLAGLPPSTLNALSAGYLASRIIYNLIYINNTTEGLANARSVVWLAGVGQIFALFIKAGMILKDKPVNLL